MIMTFFKLLFKDIRLSYGITVCDEAFALDRLLQFLIANKGPKDELIVLQDVTNENQEVNNVLYRYKNHHIIVIKALLNGDFSTFKNNLLNFATGDYLFQIDADEMPQLSLMKDLKRIIKRKYKYDCFLLPRINKVEGISPANIEEWGWNLDDKNRINFPDYQTRIFKLNGKIRWINKVHESLTGWNRQYHLSEHREDYCLLHIKDIETQRRQNEFYQSMM